MILKVLDLTISILGGCCTGLDRTDFNSFYFGMVMAVLKELILTVPTLQGCCDLESPGFNSFYFGRV